MDHYTELLQSALEAMRGYRQEHGDCQPCDTEKAIEAVLAEQSVTPKSVKTEQSAEVFTMLCCGIECPKCGTSFTVKASQPAPVKRAAEQDLADMIAGELKVSRGTAYELMRKALAEPQAAEPVGYVSSVQSGSPLMCGLSEWERKGLIAVYTHPAPTQQAAEPVAEVKLVERGGNAGLATVIHEIYNPERERLQPGDKLYTKEVNATQTKRSVISAEQLEGMYHKPEKLDQNSWGYKRKEGWNAPQLEAAQALIDQQATEPNAVLVEGFGRVAMRKLNDLHEKGYAINGVAITTTLGGKTEHGAVTIYGKVLWWPQQSAQHPDDVAVDRFAEAMKAKMAKQRVKGYGGWDDPAVCPTERLQQMLVDHIAKGDPVDVSNFAMMLWNRGERTAAQQPVLVRDLAEILGATVPEVCDALAECGGPRRSINMAVSGVEALAVAAQLKRTAVPVAWANPNDLQNFDMKVRTNGGPLHTVPLYTHPAPTQQPLTDAVIDSLYQHMAVDERTKTFTAQNWFQAGIAMAEAAHNITGSKT